MAGHRRRHGRPRTAHARRANRIEARGRHLERLADADTPSAQVLVAVGYLRSALAAVPADMANEIAREVVGELLATADRLLTNDGRRTR